MKKMKIMQTVLKAVGIQATNKIYDLCLFSPFHSPFSPLCFHCVRLLNCFFFLLANVFSLRKKKNCCCLQNGWHCLLLLYSTLMHIFFALPSFWANPSTHFSNFFLSIFSVSPRKKASGQRQKQQAKVEEKNERKKKGASHERISFKANESSIKFDIIFRKFVLKIRNPRFFNSFSQFAFAFHGFSHHRNVERKNASLFSCVPFLSASTYITIGNWTERNRTGRTWNSEIAEEERHSKLPFMTKW